MEINASQEEAQIGAILSGATSMVMTTIANIQAEKNFFSGELGKSKERITTLESEIQKLESEIEELNAKIIRLESK